MKLIWRNAWSVELAINRFKSYSGQSCVTTIVTCGLTACTPGSALGQTLNKKYGKPLPFYQSESSPILICCRLTLKLLSLMLCRYRATVK